MRSLSRTLSLIELRIDGSEVRTGWALGSCEDKLAARAFKSIPPVSVARSLLSCYGICIVRLPPMSRGGVLALYDFILLSGGSEV